MKSLVMRRVLFATTGALYRLFESFERCGACRGPVAPDAGSSGLDTERPDAANLGISSPCSCLLGFLTVRCTRVRTRQPLRIDGVYAMRAVRYELGGIMPAGVCVCPRNSRVF